MPCGIYPHKNLHVLYQLRALLMPYVSDASSKQHDESKKLMLKTQTCIDCLSKSDAPDKVKCHRQDLMQKVNSLSQS